MTDYRGLSFWHDTAQDDLTPRPALGSDLEVDVAIIGGGLTGLWTAWYLGERDPSLSIAVIEKEIVGFGASGRNGGWCSALFPRSTASLEKAHGREAALAMRRAMIDTVDEVGRVAASIGLDVDFAKGGTVAFARSPVQLAAAEAEVAEAREFGVDSIELWGPDRVKAAGALGATFDPACARLHPARLVRGLARALEARGVTIYEGTEVLDYSAHRVSTANHAVRCDKVVVATEGYGATLRATRRSVLPLYSLMIATEPLPDATWHEIGIEHGQTFTDFRHLLVYGQRTADNRFAFGGRGARYHWGSAIRPQYDRVPAVFDHLRRTLGEMFPMIGDVSVTHRWGGPLGVARDWHATASYDPAHRYRQSGRVRRGRAEHHEPGRPHPGRPDDSDALGSHRASVGEPPITPVGAGAAAVPRRQRRAHGDDPGRC